MNGSCHTYEWVMSHTHRGCSPPCCVFTHKAVFVREYTHAVFTRESVIYARSMNTWMRIRARTQLCGWIYTWIHDTHIKESWHTYKGVLLHVWCSHVTLTHILAAPLALHELNFACEYTRGFTSRIFRSHGTCIQESSSHIYRSHVTHNGVMSYIWMGHGPHMNESCYTYEWVMSHIWKRYVTHMNASRHTCNQVMSHIWRSHVTHMKEVCHTYWLRTPEGEP